MMYAVGDSVLTEEEKLYDELSGGVVKFHFYEGKFFIDFFNDEMLELLQCNKEQLMKADLNDLSSYISEDAIDEIKHLLVGEGEDLGKLMFTIQHDNKPGKRVVTRFRKKIKPLITEYYAITLEYQNKVQVEDEELDIVWHDSLINYTFDSMMKTKNMTIAMNVLLGEICQHYHVNLASVIEFEDNGQMVPEYTVVRHLPEVEREKFNAADLSMLHSMYDYADRNGIVAVEDTGDLRSGSPIKALVGVTKAKAALQCAFFDSGKFKGCIYLEDRENYHEWTKQQKMMLSLIAKILSFYLLRIKMSENIKEKLENMQNYDALTGVPTMLLFKKRILEIRKKYPDKRYVILYQDIYNFKAINEKLGYDFGDKVLKDWGFRLCGLSEEEFMVARVTSDVFIGMVPFYSKDQLEIKIDQLSKDFHRQQIKKNINCNVRICVGAYVLEPEDKDLVAAIDNANFARKILKAKGGTGQVLFYDQEMKRKIQKEMDISNSMTTALVNNEFVVYLQPKINLVDNSIAGAEALVRWQRPDGTLLFPDEFIPIFERNGFIIKLDYYVYQTVCKMIRNWLDKGITPVPVSVNVSRVHLYDESFVTRVNELVEKYRIPKDYIEFELTETVFIDNSADAIIVMDKLRELGYKISIDDFGAGYSSLTLLKDMPTDVLKLDKAFFRAGEMKREDKIIVSSIINMAKQLDMTVLSEGVENDVQFDFLKEISCDLAQGYLFAKPMPMIEFNEKYMR